MTRRWIWGLVPLSVTAFAALPCTAADRGDAGLAAYQRFSSGPPVSPFPSPPPEKPKPAAVPEEKKPTDMSAAMRAQEEANLLRRLAVCDRIKQIAMETGDSRLEEQALKAEQRATEVFRVRTANMPTASTVKNSEGSKP